MIDDRTEKERQIMGNDKEASRRWRRRVREVLNSQWDPIGAGQPPDEYDAYVDGIAAMLRDRACDEDLIAYLRWAETEQMCLPGNDERLRKVVAAIREIDPGY
jgi:hypothetical protein